jgi:hypothetical protein
MEKAIVSARAKHEYVQAIYHRYRGARRPEKQKMLNEFCQVTGHHRKHAIRLLNRPAPGAERPPRHRAVTYSPAVIEALRVIWEAAGYPWSRRLKALLPLWLPWAHRRLRLRPAVERQLLAISPRQMDRRLAPHRRPLLQRLYGRTKPGTLLKHHIPLKTDRWAVTTPGFTEIDLTCKKAEDLNSCAPRSSALSCEVSTWSKSSSPNENTCAGVCCSDQECAGMRWSETRGFSVLAVNPRIVRHFIELCFTARGASSRHVAVGCSLKQSVSDNLGDSHRAPVIARSKMTTPGSGCRHRHARDGLRFQPTARTRATRPSLVS